MITCTDCQKSISTAAAQCPNCGKPNAEASNVEAPNKKPVSDIVLGIAVFVMPFVFVWVTLNKSYSQNFRNYSFAYLILVVGLILLGSSEEKLTNTNNVTTTKSFSPVFEPAKIVKPIKIVINDASYRQVDNEIGCKSKYGDNKKEDVFNAKYKDQWFIWGGIIETVDSNRVSINIDRQGTQDLSVEFYDPNAGYDLTKGSLIKVRFRMASDGGCWLPFRGEDATIIK